MSEGSNYNQFSVFFMTDFILFYYPYYFKAFSLFILIQHVPYMEHQNAPYTTMGLLTCNVPSSQIKEAETICFSNVPSIVTENDSICPRDVNDRTLGFTLILSPGGVVTIALYVHVGSPTLVTVRLKT